MNDFCECFNWARAHPGPLTNHHPNCSHYNDSLMDVWKVTVGGWRPEIYKYVFVDESIVMMKPGPTLLDWLRWRFR
jgi:hypothetical protein